MDEATCPKQMARLRREIARDVLRETLPRWCDAVEVERPVEVVSVWHSRIEEPVVIAVRKANE